MTYDKIDRVALFDFGASRVKAALWSVTVGACVRTAERPSPCVQHGAKGEAEGRPEDYWRVFEEVLSELLLTDTEVRDVWICSEMHGFLLAELHSSRPITPYISWQDQRTCYREEGLSSIINGVSEDFQSMLLVEAGLKVRPGLPVLNLLALKGLVRSSHPVRFLTLIDWLLVRGGEGSPLSHKTMAAGTGLFSIKQSAWCDGLIESIGLDRTQLVLPSVVHDTGAPLGVINICGRSVRVWGGFGDLQAASFGLGFPFAAPIFVNLGTGSQILVRSSFINQDNEVRVTVEGVPASAVTHIPSGRALNLFAEFFDQVSVSGGGSPCFWKVFSGLRPQDILNSKPCIDLSVFKSAWGYDRGGSISKILEGEFSLDWFMTSLARSWLNQYLVVLNNLVSDVEVDKSFVLGGGLSRALPFVKDVLECLLGRHCLAKESRTGEETLDGLLLAFEQLQEGT